MSDDDDTSPAAAVAVPEASKGWSEQDRRTLIITIVGGLAANLGTVILVGAAIALAKLNRTPATTNSGIVAGSLIVLITGLTLIVGGTLLRRRLDMLWSGWFLIAAGCLSGLIGVLTLIGVAAGVK